MTFSSNCSLSNASLMNSTDCNENPFSCIASNTSRKNWTGCFDQLPQMEIWTRNYPILLNGIYLLLPLAMVVGNALLLTAVKRLQNHRISIHYWVSHLAVTDIIFASAVAIRTIINMFSLQSQLCCKLIMCLIVITFYATMTGVLGMSFVSCRSMQHQQLLSNQSFRSRRQKHLLLIAFIWIVWSVAGVKTVFWNIQASDIEQEGCYAFSSSSKSSTFAIYGIITLVHIMGVSVFQCGILYQLKRTQTVISTTRQSDFPLRTQVGQRTSKLEGRTSIPVQFAEYTRKNNISHVGKNSLSPLPKPRRHKPAIDNAGSNTSHNGKYGNYVIADLLQPGCSYQTEVSPVGLDDQKTLAGSPMEMPPKNHQGPQRATDVGNNDLHKQQYKELNRKASRSPNIRTEGLPHQLHSGRNIHLTKCVALVVTLYVVCYLPSAIYMVIYAFSCRDDLGVCSMPGSISVVLNSITTLNSILNPFVWAFKSREFKRVMKDIILWH